MRTAESLLRRADPPRAEARALQADALEQLRDPKLLFNIGEDITAWGLVGERANALTLELAVVSRVTDEPISIEQILVSQAWVGSWKDGHGGDPSMILFPPVEQHRDHYLFLVPSTFTANYVVVAMPAGTVVQLDGRHVNADEFRSLHERLDSAR